MHEQRAHRGSPQPTRSATPGTTGPATTDPESDVPPAEVRATLGALDPCALLAPPGPGGIRARDAEGPHTCEGQLDDVRVRVQVGVALDEASSSEAERGEVSGVVTLTAPEGCRLVFPVGPSHGIAVQLDGRVDDRCDVLPDAAEIVGTALAAPDMDTRLRPPGPDAHTACGLLAAAEPDTSLLQDGVGGPSEGLDHCEIASGAILARTTLGLDYMETPFDELVRRLEGDRVRLAGQDAVVVRGGQTCFVHAPLWDSDAEGRGPLSTDAVVRAATCKEAQRVAATVIEAARREPAAAGSVSELLVRVG